MARNKGTFNFSANLEVRSSAPLDPRHLVGSKADLILAETWDGGDGKAWLYDGMVVTVKDEHAQYMLIGQDPINAPLAYQNADNWKRVDAGGAEAIEVVNNLTSTSTTAALSAAQGKALNDKVVAAQSAADTALTTADEAKSTADSAKSTADTAKTTADSALQKVTDILGSSTETLDEKIDNAKDEIKESLGTVYSYKGSKATYTDLPADATAGDVWNVEAANGNIPAGTNYAWDGSKWDALGGTVDLSAYASKTQVASDIETAKSDVKTDLATDIADAKKAGTDAQTTANAAKSAAETNASNIADLTSDLEALDTSVGTRLDTLDTSINTTASELATLRSTVNDLTGGETETGGIFDTINSVKEEVLQTVSNTYATKGELTVVSEKADKTSSDLVLLTETVKTNTNGISELKDKVDNNTADLVVLKGDENTEGSVDYKIKTAIDNAKLVWHSYNG